MTEAAAIADGDAERSMLLRYLGAQRRHVLGIIEGLDDETMRRSVLPSGWMSVGLVRHLTSDVERFWFGAVIGGIQSEIDRLDEVDDAWRVADDVSVESVLDDYRSAIELADEIANRTSLDAAPAWWPAELFGDWRIENLREVILHVTVETACHAGHLDAARELLDRRQWLVVD